MAMDSYLIPLVSSRDLARLKVEAIDHKTEMVNDDVFVWLNEAEILIQEVKNLTTRTRRADGYELSRLVHKVIAHQKKYELIDPFLIPIPSLEHFSSENIVCFNSREKASDQLLTALQDDSCSMIGLYGREGSGKTTLVKAMGEKVKYLKIFHKVLLVTMIQSPNIKTIQDEIAD
ncbi:TIR-similar-domain-containing protein TSDC [Trifolium pratense]|uniref:TIR-similar-domain-containing protein TSDC n=3 Tax=Trifolium pratense TaxID=57577 RepID=A0A2K3MWR3_TRIPR|nr:putative disease resistance protein At1g63350 [Trifolium pratense]XP_045817156.1 putative disease resistance protein At1g63350 [Trifolium pratense]PNX95174.1 TIR-similar-domain-containing protein TSDC [Trifolium pratense]CAJ2633242.1 unnamed protein product [Trifolium pratense]CAJ2638358.1 unnamed protein product [Trifolium pratense]